MTERYDFAIAGAGMAGASIAAGLAQHGTCVLIEAEDRPGYHATGRSAAFWTESYGGPLVQPLTTASGPMLAGNGFLSTRGALTIGRAGQETELAAFAARFQSLGVRVQQLGRAGLEDWLPGLHPDWTVGALEPDCSDIDVSGLHQHYLRIAAGAGSVLRCGAQLQSAVRQPGGWRLSLADGRQVSAGVVINAAGAWADEVAQRCGLAPLGFTPYRRTVAQVRTVSAPPANLPLVLDLAEKFYFKPESGRLWLSPHDETPSSPCDAAPEEIDVALAIDRFEKVVDWQVQRVEHKWAGLRTFSPDRLPVYGFDPQVRDFFWFAGQGGFGIQTAPAAADLAVGLILNAGAGAVDPGPFLPDRFR